MIHNTFTGTHKSLVIKATNVPNGVLAAHNEIPGDIAPEFNSKTNILRMRESMNDETE